MTVSTTDHHSKYLAKAVAALTPEGRKRVDELLDQLAIAGRSREWVVRFAMAREAEVEAGRTDTLQTDEPDDRLNEEELDGLTTGFMTIRDQEPLDDVADWANAVLALLAEERALFEHILKQIGKLGAEVRAIRAEQRSHTKMTCAEMVLLFARLARSRAFTVR